MEHNEQDRRVRRTRKRLQEALAALMREKELKDITVRELTDLADVNRGTFYSHYKDLYDMREQVEQELFQQLHGVLAGYNAEHARGGLRPVLTAVFRFVRGNKEIFATILGRRGEELFFGRLQKLIYDMYLRECNGFYDLGSAAGTNYYLEFVVSGVVGLVRAWAGGGMAEPAEEMAALAEQMIVGGLPHRAEDRLGAASEALREEKQQKS